MDDLIATPPPPRNATALDAKTLETLLNIGGSEMRTLLCAQLAIDFQRLHDAIDTDNAADMARAAHELKGLAATIGAERLATMARSLDKVADELGPEARTPMIRTLQREVAAVLQGLSDTTLGAAAS